MRKSSMIANTREKKGIAKYVSSTNTGFEISLSKITYEPPAETKAWLPRPLWTLSPSSKKRGKLDYNEDPGQLAL